MSYGDARCELRNGRAAVALLRVSIDRLKTTRSTKPHLGELEVGQLRVRGGFEMTRPLPTPLCLMLESDNHQLANS